MTSRLLLPLSLLLASCAHLRPAADARLYLDKADIPSGLYNVDHAAVFSKYAEGYNLAVLRAVDRVQASAMDGGGYVTGLKIDPPESPIGYPLALFGRALIKPPRSSSYCSGSTYGVFVEALNDIFPDGAARLSEDRYEALRMQEPDGGRREDGVKFWGKWNDDGWGSQYALVQYSGMGEDIPPELARPGDFMNISWKSGRGHAVVFLGWCRKQGRRGLVYWSSQKNTNGFADVVLWPLDTVESVRAVRLTHPEKLFTFDVSTLVTRALPGDKICDPVCLPPAAKILK